MASKTPRTSYSQLKSELDDVLLKLQSSEVNVDEALVLHKKGLELVGKLEKYLSEAENNIKPIKAKK